MFLFFLFFFIGFSEFFAALFEVEIASGFDKAGANVLDVLAAIEAVVFVLVSALEPANLFPFGGFVDRDFAVAVLIVFLKEMGAGFLRGHGAMGEPALLLRHLAIAVQIAAFF